MGKAGSNTIPGRFVVQNNQDTKRYMRIHAIFRVGGMIDVHMYMYVVVTKNTTPYGSHITSSLICYPS
jgi:hypothetical protein